MRQALGNGTSRRLRRGPGILGVVALVTLSGCWLQPGGGAGGTRHNDHETRLTAATVTSLAEAWRAGPHDEVSEPVIDDAGRVVTTWRDREPGGESRGLVARSSTTGEVLWTRSYELEDGTGDNWIGSPSVIAGLVWLPYGYADRPCETLIRRYDPRTGAQVGDAVGATGTVTTPVIGADGVVAYGVGPCDPAARTWDLVVRAEDDGRLLWSVELPGHPQTPSMADGRLYVVTASGLHAYPAAGCGAATCSPLWTYADPGSSFWARPMAVPGGPVVVEALEQVGTEPGQWSQASVRVVTAGTGAELWRTALDDPLRESGIRGLATDGETVFVTAMPDIFAPASFRLEAYPLAGCGAAECPPAWTAPIGEWTSEAGPVVGGDVVYLDVVDEVRVYPAAGCSALTCAPLHVVSTGVQPSSLALADAHLFATFRTGNATLPSIAAYGI